VTDRLASIPLVDVDPYGSRIKRQHMDRRPVYMAQSIITVV
jgi:hypothetical protein